MTPDLRSDRPKRRPVLSDTRVPARFPVTLIPGGGIGPEVVASARAIVEATGAPIDWHEAEAGAEVVIEGTVLLHDEDQVVEVHDPGAGIDGSR